MSTEKNLRIIGNGEQKNIDISILVPSELNSYETDDIVDLKGNILSCGLITPLAVHGPYDDGTYQILSGEKRFRAMTQLIAEGHETFRNVPCYIVGPKDMDEDEKILIIESANIETRDYTSSELDIHRLNVFKALKRMHEKKDEKHSTIVKEAEKYMGMSTRYRNMYLRVVEEDNSEVSDLIKENKLGVSQADRILALEDDVQEEAINRIKEGETASNVIKEIYEKKKEEKLNEYTDNGSAGRPKGQISEVAQAIISGENVDHETLMNRFNELTESEDDEADEEEDYSKYTKYSDNNNVEDETKASMVMSWCQKMLNKDDFEDYEVEAIDLCRKVVEYYDSLN